MLEIFSSILLGLIVLILISFYKVNSTRNLAPGPVRLPILGNLVQIAWINHKEPYLAFSKLAEKYGNVLSMQLGSVYSVVFNSFDVMEEYLTKPEFSDRLFNGLIGERTFHKRFGVAQAKFPNPWHELKRISLRSLREFGFGKRGKMHTIIEAELTDVVNDLKTQAKENNGIVTFENYFTLSALNLVWSFIAGKRFEHKNPKLATLISAMKGFIKSCNLANSIIFAFPEWKEWFPDRTGMSAQRTCFKELNTFSQEFVDERRNLGLYKTCPENFVDEFLHEIDAHSGQQVKEDECEFSDEQLVSIMSDFFIAGSETSSNTLAWAILYLIRNPEVQTKLQKEIDSLVPKGTFPDAEYETKLNYVRATLAETHRLASVLPLMITRATTQDTFCGTHFIPKVCIFIIYFLQGKRSCIGEPLATMSLFHYLTVLMQNFTFHPVPNEPLPSVNPIVGVTNTPETYRAVIECRQ